MKTLLRYLFVTHRRLTLLVIVLVLCGVGAWWYSNQTSADFARQYDAYISRASEQQNAAFIPGATDNSLRSLLNQDLAQALAKETTVKDRLVLANQGLGLITELNKQVATMGDMAPAVTDAIAHMDTSARSVGNIYHRSTMLGLVSLATKEVETINQIRALSYRANFETEQIFKRIVTDKGMLTDTYIIELNAHIPVVEEQFNNREAAYTDLQQEIADIEQAFLSLGGV